jgi:NAD-specific glutamate dehydrogenase
MCWAPCLPLSASLPVFENLGFKVIAEDSYPVSLKTSDGWQGEAAVLDFLMERADEGRRDLADIKARSRKRFTRSCRARRRATASIALWSARVSPGAT